MSDIVTLNGYKIKDEKAVRSYESIAQMKADRKLKEGYHVETEGYYEANDGGHGEYVIVDDDTLVDDGGLIHVLSNGLRAKLIIDNKVNIKQFGAKGDNDTDDTESFSNFASSNINSIFIPNGTYLIRDNITFENKNLYGESKELTIFKTTSQPEVNEFQTQLNGSCTIKNIKFLQNTNGTKVLTLKNCNGILIDNCSFESVDYYCRALIDMYTNNKNITVSNCDFNLTSINNGSSAIGLCLQIREFDSTKVSENITIDNCSFKHSSSDEVLAVFNWNGKVLNTTISNCKFNDKGVSHSPFFIRLDSEYVTFINNYITRTKDGNISGIFNITDSGVDSTINIDNCYFDLNCGFLNGFIKGTNKAVVKNSIINNISTSRTLLTGINTTYDNCVFNLKDMLLFDSNMKDSTVNFTGTPSNNIFRENINVRNVEINGFSFESNHSLCVVYKDNSAIKLDNVKLNGDYSHILYFLNLANILANIEITNCKMPLNMYITGSVTKGIIANNLCTSNLSSITNVKMNNNFDIS